MASVYRGVFAADASHWHICSLKQQQKQQKLLPLLLKEPTHRQWEMHELQQQLGIQPLTCLPVVALRATRSANTQVSKPPWCCQVMGLTAMKPAAVLLAEAFSRMQARERDLLATEMDEPHDGWLQYIVEEDHEYKEASVEAMHVKHPSFPSGKHSA
ncbi:uncharacterized protein LOC113147529 [Cyclospora cayetanensis]|uniref:Uncharacterized protein LOC113147529 n=1 Tax=Cyclospora cayetanensis TaxID=88456 RepID=A0A6P6S4D2_9EIME|nr:uncharacterized protein LOC113147529 [Cyclospora cayetanensis]